MTRRKGFMIVEMLVVLGLMGAFAIVAERLFRLSVQTTTKSAQGQEDLIRLDQAMHALRDELWSATMVEAPDKSSLIVTGAKGAVEWKTLPDGYLVRIAKDEAERRWKELGLEFARQGPWVVVSRRGNEVSLLQLSPLLGSAK